MTGARDGQIHYHDSNNVKWKYNLDTKKLVNPENNSPAPPKIQKVLEQEWFQKALEKAKNILGEK